MVICGIFHDIHEDFEIVISGVNADIIGIEWEQHYWVQEMMFGLVIK